MRPIIVTLLATLAALTGFSQSAANTRGKSYNAGLRPHVP